MMNEYSPFLTVIKDVKFETPNTNTYTLEFYNNVLQKDFSSIPGQFMMLSLLGAGESAISLSDIGNNDSIITTIRDVGSVTNRFLNLKEGDFIGMRGPYGTGWPLDEMRDKDVMIAAGGMGIAPLRRVITHIKNEDMIFKYEFEKWKQIENSRFDLTVDEIPVCTTSFECKLGLVTSCFPSMKTRPKNTIALLCGPEIMMRYAAKCLETIGFKDNQIYLSLERRMKCGIGKCGHCQIGLKYVCKDGPVFNYTDIKSFIYPL